MLSDQWSPYVGRFACDWHRLPGGDLPGNHRPRRKSLGIVATPRHAVPERSGRGEDTHVERTGRFVVQAALYTPSGAPLGVSMPATNL